MGSPSCKDCQVIEDRICETLLYSKFQIVKYPYNHLLHIFVSRYVDPEAIEVLTPGGSLMPNIAMAIDPTYSPHSTTSRSSTGKLPQQL